MNVRFSLTVLFTVLFSAGLWAQSGSVLPKVSYKRYETQDSVNLNKNAVLLLFDDNTFINYGRDSVNYPPSFWFTTGRWLGNDEIVMCRTYREIENPDRLILQIKGYYKSQTKFMKILSASAFRQIDYLDYKFNVNKDLLYDKVKGVVYYKIEQ